MIKLFQKPDTPTPDKTDQSLKRNKLRKETNSNRHHERRRFFFFYGLCAFIKS